jgi:hypothetical protein
LKRQPHDIEESVRHQADERKEPQQYWGGPRNCFIGPLALGFQAQMPATFFKGDLGAFPLSRLKGKHLL